MALSTLSRRFALVAVLALFTGLLAAPAGAQTIDELTGEAVPAGELLQRTPVEDALPGDHRAGETLTLVSRLADGETRGMEMVGDLLYRSNGGYLEILNVADPLNPVVLGRFLVDAAKVVGVAVSGDYAVVAAQRPNVFANRGSLQVVDISDPTNPVGVGAVTGRSFYDVMAVGNTVYTAALGGGFRIYNIEDPTSPTELGFVTVSGGSVLGLDIHEDYAYIAAGAAGMRVVDISDPTAPTIVGSFSVDLYPGINEFATELTYADGFVYLAAQPMGLIVVDVSDPTNPTEAGHYLIDEPGNSQMRSVGVDGDLVFFGKDTGLIAFDVSDPANITRLGTIEYGATGSGQSIILDGDIAWTGNRYHGVRVIDISDPAAMTQQTLIQNGGFSFKLQVVGDIVYVVDLIGELRLIDISDPANPFIVGRLGNIPNAYRIDVDGNIAYVTRQFIGEGMEGAVVRVDVSDPSNPTIIDSTTFPTSANGVHVVGGETYVATGTSGTGVGAVFAIETGSMETIGSADPGNTAFDVRYSNDHAFVATFGSGLTVLDASNPASMVPVSMAEVGSFSNSLEIDGSTLYLADFGFAGPQGLRVIDISNPADPQELGTGDVIANGTAVDVSYANDFAYTAVDMVGIWQYDVSDPTNVATTAEVITSDRATGIDTEDNLVIVADTGTGIWIFSAPAPVSAEEGASPDALVLEGTYPNPFATTATIRYRLPEATEVRVSVHDVLGRQVATLVDGPQGAGSHEVVLSGSGLAAGVYFVRVTAGSDSVVRQITLIR
jgi:hypothetical protein